jgi:hypothetical protein
MCEAVIWVSDSAHKIFSLSSCFQYMQCEPTPLLPSQLTQQTNHITLRHGFIGMYRSWAPRSSRAPSTRMNKKKLFGFSGPLFKSIEFKQRTSHRPMCCTVLMYYFPWTWQNLPRVSHISNYSFLKFTCLILRRSHVYLGECIGTQKMDACRLPHTS